MTTTTAAPKTPVHLATKGRALWRDVTAEYDLRPDELRVLEDACREADLIERLEDTIRNLPGLVTRGSTGQTVAHPLIQEIRQHRVALRGLLAHLRLEADGDVGAAPAPGSAQDRAGERWRRTG